MTAWGGLGGLVTGAIFGSCILPLVGTAYGGFYGFFAGLILGLPSGLLVGYLTQRYVHSNQEPLDYGLKLGAAVAIFVMAGAWFIFSTLFGGYQNWWFIPGIPSLIASTTAAYASKRFAQRCLDGDFIFEKPKHREYV
jgi:hypothetical protein